MAPRDALKHLLIDKLGEYSLESLKTLQSVLKFTISYKLRPAP